MKKRSLIMALGLAASMALTACGSGESTEESTAAETEAAEVEDSEEEKEAESKEAEEASEEGTADLTGVELSMMVPDWGNPGGSF